MDEEEGQIWRWDGVVRSPLYPFLPLGCLSSRTFVNSWRPAGLRNLFVLYSSMEANG